MSVPANILKEALVDDQAYEVWLVLALQLHRGGPLRAQRPDTSTPAPFCQSCGREIPALVKDQRAHGWSQRSLAELERWQDRAG